MEIQKTTISAKPEGMTLTDGTWLSPRERTNIRQMHRKDNWKQSALCKHFDISDADMKKITGSASDAYGRNK